MVRVKEALTEQDERVIRLTTDLADIKIQSHQELAQLVLSKFFRGLVRAYCKFKLLLCCVGNNILVVPDRLFPSLPPSLPLLPSIPSISPFYISLLSSFSLFSSFLRSLVILLLFFVLFVSGYCRDDATPARPFLLGNRKLLTASLTRSCWH